MGESVVVLRTIPIVDLFANVANGRGTVIVCKDNFGRPGRVALVEERIETLMMDGT